MWLLFLPNKAINQHSFRFKCHKMIPLSLPPFNATRLKILIFSFRSDKDHLIFNRINYSPPIQQVAPPQPLLLLSVWRGHWPFNCFSSPRSQEQISAGLLSPSLSSSIQQQQATPGCGWPTQVFIPCGQSGGGGGGAAIETTTLILQCLCSFKPSKVNKNTS